jgi:hypothetical protein
MLKGGKDRQRKKQVVELPLVSKVFFTCALVVKVTHFKGEGEIL